MNYDIYHYSFFEVVKECGIYITICGCIAYVFYKSIIVFLILLTGIPLYLAYRKNVYKENRKKVLVKEFAETLYLIASNLKAGYSIENAFGESYKDIQLFYGKKSLMAAELLNIQRGLEINQSLEDLFLDFAARSQAEDIILFADVLSMAKRNGGKIPEVLSDTADRIREKICTDNEIDLIISEKKLEMRIMEVVPFLIPVYLEVTSRGYFDPLYEKAEGRVLMTGCLLLYGMAVFAAERIIKIDV